MMLTSAFVSFVSRLDACLDAVGVRPPLDRAAAEIGEYILCVVVINFLDILFRQLLCIAIILKMHIAETGTFLSHLPHLV
jgi:hypothetical protein